MKKIKKINNKIYRFFIKIISYINNDFYMKLYIRHLKKNGMKIEGDSLYISSSAYFDGTDYSLITLGKNVGISREVIFLTHDFSMNTVSIDLNLKNRKLINERLRLNNLLILKEIKVGDNSFIGARAIILQGTTIGKNVLIGAGSVVKGVIPDNSIVLGNPAKVIANTTEWLESKKFV